MQQGLAAIPTDPAARERLPRGVETTRSVDAEAGGVRELDTDGRAAQGRPWIFGEIAHFLETGETLAAPSSLEVRDILVGHLEALYAFYGELPGVRIARKHLGWYAKDRPENAAFRAVVNGTDCAATQLRMTRDYFDRLADLEPLAA